MMEKIARLDGKSMSRAVLKEEDKGRTDHSSHVYNGRGRYEKSRKVLVDIFGIEVA